MNAHFINQCKTYVQDQLRQKKLVVRYLRDKKNAPYGVVVGLKGSNPNYKSVHVGYAQCNRKADNFNKYVGIYIAAQRAQNKDWGDLIADCPPEYRPFLYRMEDRAYKYFWGKTFMESLRQGR